MAESTTKTRYGIGEWFGRDVASLSCAQRAANLALAENKSIPKANCPFASALDPQATCSKRGGVCTIRKYEQHTKGVIASLETPVTVCPQRFLQDAELVRWAGEVMLGTSNPEVSKAIPFINDLVNSIGIETMGSSTRFSWALVHPSKKLGLRWCRLETQAAHCSDRSMSNEFHSWAEANSDTIPFPTEVRHPNYARTELIRLSAHLNRTVPVVRDSGAKTAVIVDEHFFTKISHVHALEGGLANKLAQAEVVWLVTRFEEGKLIPGNVIYSRLDDSIRALLAGPSVGKKAFEDSIRRALADPSLRGTRVFKL